MYTAWDMRPFAEDVWAELTTDDRRPTTDRRPSTTGGDEARRGDERDDVGANRIRPRRAATPGDAHDERADDDSVPRRAATPNDAGGERDDTDAIDDAGGVPMAGEFDSPLPNAGDVQSLSPLHTEILRRNAECNAGAPADLFAPRDGFVLPPFRWDEGRRGLAAVIILLIMGVIALPATALLLMIAIGMLLYFAFWLYSALHLIDASTAATVGAARIWPVHSKVYPLYKFVDIYRAAQTFAGQHPRSVELRSAHPFTLGAILRGLSRDPDRRLNTATSIPRKIGYEQETYLPIDTFWLLPPSTGAPANAGVIRVQLTARSGTILLEAAAPRAGRHAHARRDRRAGVGAEHLPQPHHPRRLRAGSARELRR
ncbi:MAG: hypothetical protein ACJ8CR_07735 [Roseiflexaceae bacterium]